MLMVSDAQPTAEERLLIIKDDKGKPAGLQKGLDNGYLKNAPVILSGVVDCGECFYIMDCPR